MREMKKIFQIHKKEATRKVFFDGQGVTAEVVLDSGAQLPLGYNTRESYESIMSSSEISYWRASIGSYLIGPGYTEPVG